MILTITMNIPNSFTIYELDEDLEISGRRVVSAQQVVIPLYSLPSEVAMQRFQLNNAFRFVEQLEIGWFDSDKDVDYALANRSLWYLEIETILPVSSEKEYDRAWNTFRNTHVEKLVAKLGKSSWGFGKGIASRRGQDLFIIELGGLEHPQWYIYVSIEPADTWTLCWNVAHRVEDFFKDIKNDGGADLSKLDKH